MQKVKTPIATPWSKEGKALLDKTVGHSLRAAVTEAKELSTHLPQPAPKKIKWVEPADRKHTPVVDVSPLLAKVKEEFPGLPRAVILPEKANVSKRMLAGITKEELKGVLAERWWNTVPEEIRDSVKEKTIALRKQVLELEELAAREEGFFTLPEGELLSSDPVVMEAQLEAAKLTAVFQKGLELIGPMKELAALGFVASGVRPKDLYKCVVEVDPAARTRALNRARVQKFRDKLALKRRKAKAQLMQKTMTASYMDKYKWNTPIATEHFFDLSYTDVPEGIERILYAGSVQYEAAKGFLNNVGIESIDTLVDMIASVYAVYTWHTMAKLFSAFVPDQPQKIVSMRSYSEGMGLREKLAHSHGVFTKEMAYAFRGHFIADEELADGDAHGFGDNWKKSYIDVACVVFYERDKDAWNVFVAHTLQRCDEWWRGLLGDWCDLLDSSREFQTFRDQLEASCFL